MARNPSNHAFRDIRTLFAQGALGSLPDAQLLERFLNRDSSGREEAFAALVQRHGPMVWRVCRRMLSGSADADDAFQAVFLVLARKAGSIHRADGLKPWLYGVSVRTAKEARRRAARRAAREGGAMDHSRAVTLPPDDRADLLRLLDEEINRLPRRFRDAILLCDLDGLSRHDAAAQLRLPEGTLSSRLNRGRALLRDRLTRRGVSFGTTALAAAVSDAASAAFPDRLAESTAQLALQFVTGGTVPVAVESLAQGVIQMISLTRMVLLAGVILALGSAVGLSLTDAPGPDDKPPAPSPPVADNGAEKASGDVLRFQGIVVDEDGQPVANALVRVNPFMRSETRITSRPDGTFTIFAPLSKLGFYPSQLLARPATGEEVGIFNYPVAAEGQAAEVVARVVLKPALRLTVHVTDSNKAPVSDAGIEVAGDSIPVASAKTGADGSATLDVPADARIQWIVAMKPGLGLDYAEFGFLDETDRWHDGISADAIRVPVSLALDRGKTVRVWAIDRDDEPLAGIPFKPVLPQKEGRRSSLNYVSKMLTATTGPDGIATFDWLPPWRQGILLRPQTLEYSSRDVIVKDGGTKSVTTRLMRPGTIRGRVVHDGGSPARGVEVKAFGSNRGYDRTRTGGDGTYEMRADPGEAYAVFVDDPDGAAPSRPVIVNEGLLVSGVDFTLTSGTLIRGTVTVGADNRPVPDQSIQVEETLRPPPAELRPNTSGYEVKRRVRAKTDADGHYTIRVGRGDYVIGGPQRTEARKVVVRDQPEIIRDFHMPRPDKGPIMGRVTFKGKGVAGASVEFFSDGPGGGDTSRAKTDIEGRFSTMRWLDRSAVHAKSADGSLGAVLDIGEEDPEVMIELAPTAIATGTVLDETGKPASDRLLSCPRVTYHDGQAFWSEPVAPKVVTDDRGHFTLPSLVVGQRYEIVLEGGNGRLLCGRVRAEKSDHINLGILRAGAYSPPELINRREISAFTEDAPDAGRAAPPIAATTLDGKPLSLDDYKGRYVLLDFWATWCGPCIKEIPQLQSVYDAFGKDERFAIVSLSIDEKIDQPKEFQETRKLPWTQAFIGQEIHGPIPQSFGVRAIPAFVLIGPEGKIVARGMRGEEIKAAVSKVLASP